MTIYRTSLCVAYAVTAVVALVGTWANNLQYLDLGMVGMNVRFWQDTLANPASRSITVDILTLGMAACTWILLEGRRLSMRGAWLYVLFGVFVAMGAALPMFLLHRERVLATGGEPIRAGTLSAGELVGLALLGLVVLAYTFLALSR